MKSTSRIARVAQQVTQTDETRRQGTTHTGLSDDLEPITLAAASALEIAQLDSLISAAAPGDRMEVLRDHAEKAFRRLSYDHDLFSRDARELLDDLARRHGLWRPEQAGYDAGIQDLIEDVLAETLDRPSFDDGGDWRPDDDDGPTRYAWVDKHNIMPRKWLYEGYLERRYVSATIGAGGTAKTAKAFSEAIAMATGLPLLGVKPSQPLSVWYYNLEDPMDELRRRFQAAAHLFGIGRSDIAGRLFIDSGRDKPLIIGRHGQGGVDIDGDTVSHMIAEIQRCGIDVVIIDPFVSCHEINENDNGAIDTIVKTLGKIADQGNCAISLNHHSRKGSEGDTSAESSRGARSLVDACRAVRVISAIKDSEAVRAGVDRRSVYKVTSDKVNNAKPGAVEWMQVVGVPLGNGGGGRPEDVVGVATAWDGLGHVAEIGDAEKVAAVAAIGEKAWRKDHQAAAWVGIPIAAALDLNLSSKPDKAKIRALVERWISDGTLSVVERLTEKREKKPFVVVAR